MLISWLICLLVWLLICLLICLHIHIWAPSYCLMYPAALHIFVSAAWLMVCCQYDSPQLWVPEPGGHCCQSGCCGGAHVSSSQSPKSSSCRHGFWCRDGVREEYYWGYYHTRSFQRLHIFITGIAWSAAAHPALLFCLILIRDGNPCVVPLVPQHLGSAPHSILGLWLERTGLNERSQNKAAYVWKLGAVSTLRFEC